MKKKKEFSKIIFVYISILFTIIIAFSMVLMWYTQDTSSLSILISCCGGLMATTVGFYSWKAKAENVIKIAKDNNLSVSEYKETVQDVNDLIDDGIPSDEVN